MAVYPVNLSRGSDEEVCRIRRSSGLRCRVCGRGGCFDFAACLARRYPDCRRKHLTEDPAVAAFVQGLKNSFSGESGKAADTHRSV